MRCDVPSEGAQAMDYESMTGPELIEENQALRRRLQELEQEKSEWKREEGRRDAVLRELRKSEELYRQLAENAHDQILFMDMDGVIRYVNSSTRNLAAPIDIIGLNIRDISTSEFCPKCDELFRKRSGGDASVFSYEWELMRPDGSGHFVMDVRTSLMTQDGRPSGVLVVARDVTDQRRRENEIRESEERHRSILQTSMDGFYVTDMEGRFLTVNEAYSRICGYTERELRAMRITDLSVKPAEEVTSFIRESIARGQDRFETLIRHKNGSTLPVEVTISYRAEDSGKLVGFLRDITDHREQEKKLRQQKEEFSHLHRLATVGEIAASIAHEIHQPLTAIMNNAQAADRFLSSDNTAAVAADVRECLKDIVADDRRAADVIRNLRLFLQRKRGDQAIVDVNDVIRGVLEILHGELVDMGVHVVQALSSDLAPVQCDCVALQQVLMNLIMNACDALSDVDRQRREILIRTAMKGSGAVVVSVQDKGTGIDPENMHRIFESYYTTKPEGLGMGLSISKSVITSHGGRIWAENNGNGGATFYFTLPAREG
jgi:two-component system sensor kinase FixL